MWCVNSQQVESQRLSLIAEETDRQVMEESGFLKSVVPNLLAFAADPVNLVNVAVSGGIGTAVAAATKLGKAGKVRKALAPWVGGIVGTGSWGALHGAEMKSVKQLRTWGDVAEEAALCAILQPVFIGLAKGLSKSSRWLKDRFMNSKSEEFTELKEGVDYYIRTGDTAFDLTAFREEDGSKQLYYTASNGNPQAIAHMPKFVREWIFNKTPAGEMAVNRFSTVNDFGEMAFRKTFVTNALVQEGPMISRGPAMEALIEMNRGTAVKTELNYLEALNSVLKANKNKKIPYDHETFQSELREAKADGGVHHNVEVASLAKYFLEDEKELTQEAVKWKALNVDLSKNFAEKYLSRAEARMSLEDLAVTQERDVVNDLSYGHRVYDKEMVALTREDFEKLLAKGALKTLRDEQKEQLTLDLAEADREHNSILLKGGNEIWERLQRNVERIMDSTEEQISKLPTKVQNYLNDAKKNLQETLDKSIAEYDSKMASAEGVYNGKLLSQKEAKYGKTLQRKQNEAYLNYKKTIEKTPQEAKTLDENLLDTFYKSLKKYDMEMSFLEAKASEKRKKAVGKAYGKLLSVKRLTAKAKASARGTTDTILGMGSPNERYVSEIEMMIQNPSYGKKIGVNVDDRLLFPWLEKDVLQINKTMHSVLDPLIAQQKVLKSYGYGDMKHLRESLDMEYSSEVEKLGQKYRLEAKTPEEKVAELQEHPKARNEAHQLIKDYERAKELLDLAPSLVSGMYGKREALADPRVTTFVQGMRNLNYFRLLGGQLLAALQDVSMMVENFGLKNTIEATLNELRIVGTPIRTAKEKESQALFRKMLNSFGVALDRTLTNVHERQIRENFGPNLRANLRNKTGGVTLDLFERSTAAMSVVNSKISFINHWNDFAQTLNAKLFTTRLMELIEKPVKTKADLRELSTYRFPLEMIPEAREQFALHGLKENDYYFANTHLWTNPEVREAFNAAVLTNTFNTVVIPSAGDTPLFMRKLWGKFFFSYKSIMFSMMNNIFQKFATGNMSHPFAYLASATAIGVSTEYLRSWLSNDEYDFRDPKLYLRGAAKIDALGFLGELGKTAMDLYEAANLRDGSGFAQSVADLSPNLSIGFSIAKGVARGAEWGVGKFMDEEESWKVAKPLSERELRSIKTFFPFHSQMFINFLATRGIGEYVRESGGKPMKTRREKFAEENRP
jgi:hypothetical protein